MVDPENKDLQKPSGFPPETSAGNSLQSSGDPPTVMHTPSFGSATGPGSSKGREGSTLHRSNSNSGDHERQAQMPQPGIRLGGYELGPSIGTGGMATVYAARDLSLERTVALKILPPDSAHDNEVLQLSCKRVNQQRSLIIRILPGFMRSGTIPVITILYLNL